jgi:hypothetical protein
MSGERETRISRRSLIAGATAAVGCLLAPPPALAAPGDTPELWSHWIGPLRGAPVIRLARRCALVGVRWEGPEEARVQLRARLVNGHWTRWGSASVAGHGPDRVASPPLAQIGEPLWVGDADTVQLRSSRPLRAVRLHLVSTAVTGAGVEEALVARSLPLAAPRLDAGPGQPPIIARRAWARGRAHPAAPPAYGDVRLGFVHHTDGLNGYSPAQVPSIIYAIFLYHRFVNGWNDIGYNFVIDAFGRIWEAREGGIDLPVIGAQAGGYNTQSTGAAILGDFMTAMPSAAALRALEHLLAWKLSLHGIPASGDVRVEVDPSAAFYTPFRPGQIVTLPRVAGHRQACTTDCPGNALFAHMGRVRHGVARLAGPRPASLTLAVTGGSGFAATYLALGGGAAAAGDTQTLAGRLLDSDDAPLVGATVELQQILSGGATRTLQRLTTDADGNFACRLALSTSTLVRALHRQAPAVASPLLAIKISPVVTVALRSSSPLTIIGTVTPPQREVTVELYRQGARRPLRRRRAQIRDGAFAVRLGRPRPGSYVIVARTPASASNAAGASAPLKLTLP